MSHPDLPLQHVQVGMCLLLCDDPLLEPVEALHLFHSPTRVIAVHQCFADDDALFLNMGGVILRASGWQGAGVNAIVLDLALEQGRRARVCFPDDQHFVETVRVWSPKEQDETRRQLSRTLEEFGVIDPASGHVHDRRDLSAYRLPAFWRNASVIWCALPASWISARGRVSELHLLEALGGVRHPAPAAIRASEKMFHSGTSICIATLAWYTGTVHGFDGEDASDQIFHPVLDRLSTAFGSAETLRSAGLGMVESALDEAGIDATYLAQFRTEREFMSGKVRRKGRPGASL